MTIKRVCKQAEIVYKKVMPNNHCFTINYAMASMWKDQPNSQLIIIFIILKRDDCILSVCVCVCARALLNKNDVQAGSVINYFINY